MYIQVNPFTFVWAAYCLLQIGITLTWGTMQLVMFFFFLPFGTLFHTCTDLNVCPFFFLLQKAGINSPILKEMQHLPGQGYCLGIQINWFTLITKILLKPDQTVVKCPNVPIIFLKVWKYFLIHIYRGIFPFVAHTNICT